MRTLATLALLLAMSSTPTTPTGQPGPMQPSDYTPAAPANVVSWQLKRLPPPSQLYVGVDDVLRVGAASNQANEIVTVNYRLLRAADGVVVVGQFTVGPLVAYALTSQDQHLAEGFLLSASCQAKVATTRGQTFVRLFLNPKALGAGQPAQQLMADYVTTAMASGYPNGRITSPQEGPGWVHANQYNNPARGHDWGETDGLLGRRRLIGVRAALTTSAIAGSRVPLLEVLDNLLNVVLLWAPTTAQAPSNTENFVWSAAPLVLTPTSTNVTQTPLPDNLILPAGYSVQATTTGLDTNAATGDLWSTIFAYYEEWLDNV